MPANEIELENLNIQEKVNLLKSIEQNDKNEFDNSFDLLKILSDDTDDEVRWTVAEILFNYDDIDAEKILMKLLADPNEVVRVCACESLSNGQTRESFILLRERFIKDKNSLVRGYAAGSMVEIAKRDSSIPDRKLIPFLEKRLKSEKNQGVKIRIYEALFNFGEEQYLNLLLNEINNRDYRNRGVIVNIIKNVISDINKNELLAILKKRLLIEKTIAVRSLIEGILNNYNI